MELNSKKKVDKNFCCVPQCSSRGRDKPRPSFHKFPDPKTTVVKLDDFGNFETRNARLEWIRLLKIGKPVTNRMVVCSKHFKAIDFYGYNQQKEVQKIRLKKTALPTEMLPVTSCDSQSKMLEKEILSNERQKRRDNRQLEMLPILSTVEVQEENAFNKLEWANVLLSLSEKNTGDGIDEENQLSHESEMKETNSQFRSIGTQVVSGDISLNRFNFASIGSKSIQCLTGLPEESFKGLIPLIDMAWEGKNLHPNFTIAEQIIMTMMRVKNDAKFQFISIFFQCTATTCKNIFIDMIQALSVIFKEAIVWPSKEAILRNMPKYFKTHRNTRVILDCTEFYVAKKKCYKCKLNTYSNYYSGQTIKVLFGVTPSGMLSFVSKGYGGRVSDQEIVNQSGILDLIEPYTDAVMVDKGFLIEQQCLEKGITLIRPPFLRSKKQFSQHETINTKTIAAARVHVERRIQRIKNFGLLGGKIPWTLTPFIDSIILTVGGITNCGNPILADKHFNLNISSAVHFADNDVYSDVAGPSNAMDID